MLPRVQTFSDQIDEYNEDNIQMKSIIQNFDITLSLKCSKDAFKILEMDLLKKFISYEEYEHIDVK